MHTIKLTAFILLSVFLNGVKIQQSTPAGSSTTPFISSFGDMLVAEKVDSFNMMFQYNVPTDLVTNTTANSGTITSEVPFAVLTAAGSTVNSSAQLESKQRLRYVPGHEGYAYFTAIFTTGIASSTQYIGLIDDNDGWAIGYNGADFSIFWKRGGSNVSGYPLASSSFNLDALDGTGPSKMTLDPTKLNVYRISFGWLGAAPVVFEVLREDGTWFPFHMIKFPNTYTTASTNSSVLPMRAYAYANSAASSVVLKTPSWNCGSVGKDFAVGRSFQYGEDNTLALTGDDQFLFSIKNNTTFPIGGAVNNKITVDICYFAVSNKSSNSTNFKIVRNPTLSGTSYTNVDSTNSCMSYSSGGSYTSGGTTELVVPLAGNGQEWVCLGDSGIPIKMFPGDEIAFLVDTDANDTTVNSSCRWREPF